MALATQKLELRQGQSLVMTPQLQQAIRLLALSNAELTAFVEEELERNPLLERDAPDGDIPQRAADSDGPDPDSSDPDSYATAGEPEAPELHLSGFDEPAAEAAFDSDPATLYSEDSPSEMPADAAGAMDWSRAGTGGHDSSGDYDFDAHLAAETSLRDHLTDQLMLAIADPVDRLIGRYLVDLTDDAGYCRVDIAETASVLGTDPAHVLRVLRLCQGFEPAGIMARDLRECLALQLEDQGRLDPEMVLLLDHLEWLGRGDLGKLQVILDVDRQTLQELIAELRMLKPKPGVNFGASTTQIAVPDVFVREGLHGAWIVELNSDAMPRVLVNNRYVAEVQAKAKSESDKVYIHECAANASWLAKSLDQRARTILKVSQEIVRQQDAFLAKGVAWLKPLNLRTVAAAIDMHESTVSRVTTAKWMSTPRGLFELKYFFTVSIASADGGEAHSAEAVRHRIKTMIDQESAQDILSDDRIVELLREMGVDIARRTVAKYREALRIPSSLDRKRRFADSRRGAA